MIVETHNQLGQPCKLQASRLIVRNDNGTPVVVVVEAAPGAVWVVRRGDVNFERMLQQFGIKDTVISVKQFDDTQLPQPEGRLLYTPEA